MAKNILVTGTGGRSVGAGILHALAHSSTEVRERWNVIAADADPFSWGLYQTEQSVILPYANRPEYISAVRRAVQTYRVDAVIPGTQNEIQPLLDHSKELEPAVVISNRVDLLPLMLEKFLAADQLRQLGYPFIQTIAAERWREVAKKHGFPLVLKPTRGTGASRGVYLIRDAEHMEQVLPMLDASTAPCVQPYVGSGEEEYTVGVLTSKRGSMIDSIVMRRKLVGLSLNAAECYNGKTFTISSGYSQGYFIQDAEIQGFCESLAMAIGSCGPLNVQLRRDPTTGTLYVFEIHPRFSGTTPMRADAGFNEVDIILRNFLFGEEFGRIPYRTNLAAIRAFQHVLVPIDQMRVAVQ